jgi:signal transduction histidine kinase
VPSTERLSSLAALYPGTAVLDEIGIGLLLLDQAGEVAATNAIADELVRRRVSRGAHLLDLLDRTRTRDDVAAGDQRLVEAFDGRGQKSIIGYRFVRSPSFGTIFTLRDITELERGRAQLQTIERLSQVGRACAMVAHEIGNPLAAIKATVQSIEREAAAAGLGDPITAVSREIDRLDKILGQLLGFVRHRAPRKARADLSAIVARARAAAGARLDGIAWRPTFGALPWIHGDADQLQQVFLNLFLNAADAMPGGGVLWVRADTAGDRLSIRVEDDGCGVPAELREKVFESFFTTKPAGVGLGLSVSYRIIVDHGGSISIEDREGGPGTSVELTLPLARSE